MRVLITGGGGMLGANLARRLVREGRAVTATTRQAERPLRLADLPQVKVRRADCTDVDALRAVFDEAAPEVVFHLASSAFNPATIPPHEHVGTNVAGTLNVLEQVRGRPVRRLIVTGSAAEYGSGHDLAEDARPIPGTVYGASKLCASILCETYARLHGVPVVGVRLFTPFGPWERPSRLIPHTILAALKDEPVRINGGRQERDFTYVDDCLDALVAAADAPLAPGTILNVCSGTGTSVREVVETVLELMQSRVAVHVDGAQRSDEIQRISGDSAKARKLLGWQPRYDLRRGLEKTIAWFAENADLARALT